MGGNYYTSEQGRSKAGLVFASIPLIAPNGTDRVSASLGVGARARPDMAVATLIRPGLSWGRGLSDGWLAIDASTTHNSLDQQWRPKLDLTWGYDVTDRWTTIAQVQTGHGTDGDHYAKLVNSISYIATDTYRINLGWVQAMTGDKGGAINLEIWAQY